MTCTNRKNCLYLSRRDIDVHDPRVDQPTWIYLCTIELFLEENRGGGGACVGEKTSSIQKCEATGKNPCPPAVQNHEDGE